MGRIVLLGELEGKRKDYFIKGARSLGAEVAVFTYEDYFNHVKEGDCIKLDPPPMHEVYLRKLEPFAQRYYQYLKRLGALQGVHFLNSPQGIWTALDKRRCKFLLKTNHIAMTPWLEDEIDSVEGLLAMMARERAAKIFIKPRFGSGAAGVTAFMRHGGKNTEVLYTSLAIQDNQLINTKRVQKSTDIGYNRRLLSLLLAEECLFERWVPKASFGKMVYDLRVVYSLGKMAFIVARGAYGPITNLHLNDLALDWTDLHLPKTLLAKINTLCAKTLACFEGVRYAGIDILIPAGDLAQVEPMVIEVNGQGDLIYKDIFAENKIYQGQIAYLLTL